MQEAVAQMRDEFGQEAVILDTRVGRRRGFWRLFGKKRVEVVAALEVEQRKAPKGKQREVAMEVSKGHDSNRPMMAKPVQEPSDHGQSRDLEIETRPAKLIWQLYQEISQGGLRSSVPAATSEIGATTEEALLPSALVDIQQRLIDSDTDERLATAIVQSVWNDLEDPLTAPKVLTRLVAERMAAILRCVPPWEFDGDLPKVVALVGPTGVGKTTTLAKIAANYSMIAGADVGLMTLDTHRIAAVEQLRTYAQIIGIPLKVAETAHEVKEGIESWSRKELILIDTAGMSQRDTERLQNVEMALEPVTDIERHLVFSATTRYRDLVDIIRRFDEVGFERLIATKLDETTSYGMLLTAYALARRPYSFLADGQAVPECIQAAESSQIADLILGDA